MMNISRASLELIEIQRILCILYVSTTSYYLSWIRVEEGDILNECGLELEAIRLTRGGIDWVLDGMADVRAEARR